MSLHFCQYSNEPSHSLPIWLRSFYIYGICMPETKRQANNAQSAHEQCIQKWKKVARVQSRFFLLMLHAWLILKLKSKKCKHMDIFVKAIEISHKSVFHFNPFILLCTHISYRIHIDGLTLKQWQHRFGFLYSGVQDCLNVGICAVHLVRLYKMWSILSRL